MPRHGAAAVAVRGVRGGPAIGWLRWWGIAGSLCGGGGLRGGVAGGCCWMGGWGYRDGPGAGVYGWATALARAFGWVGSTLVGVELRSWGWGLASLPSLHSFAWDCALGVGWLTPSPGIGVGASYSTHKPSKTPTATPIRHFREQGQHF